MNRLIIGSPNKNNFVLQRLIDDLDAGLTLIDPTGTIAPEALNIIPLDLTQRVLYFEPADMDHPVGINLLQNVPPDERHPLTEKICSYFEAMWPNGWGPQSNFILANCLRLLLDTPGSTLLGVLPLLQDPDYPSFLESCLVNCNDPVVQKNWAVINAWSPAKYADAVAPLQNKVGTLLMSPMIRNIVGQEVDTTAGANIIIANLDRAKIGDLTARLLAGGLSRWLRSVYMQ